MARYLLSRLGQLVIVFFGVNVVGVALMVVVPNPPRPPRGSSTRTRSSAPTPAPRSMPHRITRSAASSKRARPRPITARRPTSASGGCPAGRRS